MKTVIEKRRYLDSLKLSFYAVEVNGLYYCKIWENNKYFSTGKIGYKSFDECIVKTENIFYQKYKNKILNISG